MKLETNITLPFVQSRMMKTSQQKAERYIRKAESEWAMEIAQDVALFAITLNMRFCKWIQKQNLGQTMFLQIFLISMVSVSLA